MTSTAAITPEIINHLADGVSLAMAMLAGMKLDIFTPLNNGPLTTEEIAVEIGVRPRRLGPLLNALVGANLLTVDNDRFSNSDEAARFFVKCAPDYLGSRHQRDAMKWSSLLKTADSITSDSPQARLDYSTMSPEELESFYSGGYAAALAAGQELAERYDFSGYQRLVDVAGGSGGVAIGISVACPSIHATVVELPGTVPFTRDYVEAAGASLKVEAIPGNVVEGPLPGSYDVAVMKSIIQVLSPDDARKALSHVNKSLVPGGALFIMGVVLDDSRLSPPYAVSTNLTFLNVYDEGRAYTESEYRDWLDEVGFVFLERVVTPNGTSIIKARK